MEMVANVVGCNNGGNKTTFRQTSCIKPFRLDDKEILSQSFYKFDFR
jgi:hypothetical protein